MYILTQKKNQILKIIFNLRPLCFLQNFNIVTQLPNPLEISKDFSCNYMILQKWMRILASAEDKNQTGY